MTVRPAKTQISLGICPVWSESSLCAEWVATDSSFLHADSEDSDQTGRMPRLIWVFAGRTCHFVGFVMRRLILCLEIIYSSNLTFSWLIFTKYLLRQCYHHFSTSHFNKDSDNCDIQHRPCRDITVVGDNIGNNPSKCHLEELDVP